ncbi:nucleoside hydrolase [Nocardia sp. NBC_01329]|uniref:nucleoside hydrolase n=1 Tax=Nocardia sp. NBC_01329 TaxID=2903594 RepID=UPI002E109CAB|nr:nucleoside hydrolase [Nocardia sp. NBC_01329]
MTGRTTSSDSETLWASAPLILDAAIGTAPDSAITVAIAAAQPNLSLVLTSDESAGRRARLARHLLDLLGRTDVRVVAGRELGGETIWTAGDSIPAETIIENGGVSAAVESVLSRHNGQVSWVGLGPMSNLADLLSTNPEVGPRLAVTQACGGTHVSPTLAERNIALDISAAHTVISSGIQLTIVTSTVAVFILNTETVDTTGYRILARSTNPISVLLRSQMDQWFAQFGPYSDQHGPMTLAVALGADFIETEPANIELDSVGRMHTGGQPVTLAHHVNYVALGHWFTHQLAEIERYGVVRYHRTPRIGQLDPRAQQGRQ